MSLRLAQNLEQYLSPCRHLVKRGKEKGEKKWGTGEERTDKGKRKRCREGQREGKREKEGEGRREERGKGKRREDGGGGRKQEQGRGGGGTEGKRGWEQRLALLL